MPGPKNGWVYISDAIKKARPDEAPYPAGLASAIEAAAEEAPAAVEEAPAEDVNDVADNAATGDEGASDEN